MLTPFADLSSYHEVDMPVKKKIERGDEPNPHRVARANGAVDIVTLKDEKAQVYKVMSLIDLMMKRGQINSDQHRAGSRFYADWYHSGLSGAGAIDYSAIRVDTSRGGQSHRSLMAMARFDMAVKAIGRIHCHPLTSMVLLEMSPEEYGRTRCGQKNEKLARLAALTLLIASLDALDDHYSK